MSTKVLITPENRAGLSPRRQTKEHRNYRVLESRIRATDVPIAFMTRLVKGVWRRRREEGQGEVRWRERRGREEEKRGVGVAKKKRRKGKGIRERGRGNKIENKGKREEGAEVKENRWTNREEETEAEGRRRNMKQDHVHIPESGVTTNGLLFFHLHVFISIFFPFYDINPRGCSCGGD